MQGQIRLQSFLLREPGEFNAKEMACGLKLARGLAEAKGKLPESSLPGQEKQRANGDR